MTGITSKKTGANQTVRANCAKGRSGSDAATPSLFLLHRTNRNYSFGMISTPVGMA